MNHCFKSINIASALLFIFSQTQAVAQTRERSEVPTEYQWNLEDLYPSVEAWEEAKDKVVSQFDEVEKFKGKIGKSAKNLLKCLEFNTELSKEFGRLASYASMKSDMDIRDSNNLSMKQELQQLATEFGSKAAFITPEIVELGKKKIDSFIKKEPKLKIYKFPLYDALRTKDHTLSDKEEKILAQAGLLSSGPYDIFSIFRDAEAPFPTIKLSDGNEVTLSNAAYTMYRSVPNQADREAVFKAFFGMYEKFKGTFGAQLYANVKTDIFYAKTRNYESSLHSALDSDNIPVEVYKTLIKNVNDNLDTLHRYLNLKKRMLKVDTLKYSDLYTSPVKDVELKYTYEEAQKLILDSLEPLGKSYQDTVAKAFKERWLDVYPTPGKRSGAYSNGSAYDVHPYMLLNYNGQYEDVSTTTHELGHTMHSYYANKAQPYPTADYSIFVAEVASTFNEALLIQKMLDTIKDDDIRLSLLMNYLEGIRTTVVRQTQFAEFELAIHDKAEGGEPLTGDLLNKIYGDILKRYYGHDKGVCYIDDLYSVEWAYIPHFYYNFYVYQYATSFTASAALSEKVLAKENGVVEKYMNMLAAGGSDYPIELLKQAGVDMTTSDPFNEMMAGMNRAMDEVEKILDK
ncbi:MAG: oligoendopeptidase F [Sedimentisphaerales bacterium]|nr:oligoendopeptidase F [Sedimentisphaerales bacterium]